MDLKKLDALPDPCSNRQLAEAIGKTAPTIGRWQKAGILPHLKVGGRYLMTRAHVEKFRDRCQRDSGNA